MAGTRIGGAKAAATNKAKYGDDFYSRIGHIGGAIGSTGGFASSKVGKDGLTGPERAKIAGRKGGKISKRGEQKTPLRPHYRGDKKVSLRKLIEALSDLAEVE